MWGLWCHRGPLLSTEPKAGDERRLAGQVGGWDGLCRLFLEVSCLLVTYSFILIVSTGLPFLMAGLGNDVVMGGMCYQENLGCRFPIQLESLAVWFSSPVIWLYLSSWECGEANSLWFFFVVNLGMRLENRQWLLFPLDKDPLTMHELEFAVRYCRGEAKYIGWLAWDELGESSEVGWWGPWL